MYYGGSQFKTLQLKRHSMNVQRTGRKEEEKGDLDTMALLETSGVSTGGGGRYVLLHDHFPLPPEPLAESKCSEQALPARDGSREEEGPR